MPKKKQLIEYQTEFYKKFPDKKYILFLKKEKQYLFVQDKYGICKIAQSHLMRGYFPTIRIAINPKEYFINRAREVHGDKYDYSLVEYKGTDTKIKIICPIHGIFKMTPHSLIPNKCGCNACGYLKSSKTNGELATGWNDSDWFKKARTSNYFDSFKCYIIKCWDNEEEFYKIGKTYKTLKSRFPKDRMPYNYSVIKLFEFKDLTIESAKQCSQLERKLINKNKENSYIPKSNIRGKYECFKKIKNI